ncbi:hypothetical protein L3Q82_001876 [Scortum barcoo]|uniref:Uncharacterized protein n=1 Tax=Scortum barcoo TaxID=214431 RepID=A0ACB8W517_9TELE|nr:hypothetical protein L3Q82_001876 [Scortum barcoo]
MTMRQTTGARMDFYCRDESYNLTDITSDYSDYNLYVSISKTDVLIWTNLCIGLPLTLVAIYALYSLVQKDHVTPIYVINLLISDLIQLCCMIIQVIQPTDWTPCETYYYIYFFGLLSSVGLERYLVVAWPLWYHFRRTIKSSVVVCVVVWALPLVCVLPVYFLVDFQKNIKDVTSPGLALPGPHPGARPGVGARRRAPGGRVFAHGTRPGSARNGDVGPPSSRLTTRRKVHEGPGAMWFG